jgi:hypothetical protein
MRGVSPLMRNSMIVVQQMANLSKFGNPSKLVLGNVEVEYFTPYTRTTWEFTVAGALAERRYSPKTAAKYWCELHTQHGR